MFINPKSISLFLIPWLISCVPDSEPQDFPDVIEPIEEMKVEVPNASGDELYPQEYNLSSGDEEENSSPDSCANVNGINAIKESTFSAKGDDATDDVENTKHCCCLGIAGILEVRLGGVGNTLLHYNIGLWTVSLVRCSLC